MTESIVRDFYASEVQAEWRRLVKDPYHRLEFDTTLHFLGKYLPPGGHLLDAGGGPGRYTCEMAQRGYQVTLFDLTPANLEFARRRIKRLKLAEYVPEIALGSISDLSRYADDTFDAVLCTGGPISHILDAEQRQKALSELVRVAKPSAPIFVSVMSRLSVLVVILDIAQREIDMPHFKQILETGDYFGGQGFTACHFFLPEELRAAFGGLGVEVLEMAGLEGLSTNHRRRLNQVARDETRWHNWLEAHYRTCTHPAVVGTSEHMLLIAHKK